MAEYETDVIGKIQNAITRIHYIRVIMTIFLLGWLAVVTYFMLFKFNKVSTTEKIQSRVVPVYDSCSGSFQTIVQQGEGRQRRTMNTVDDEQAITKENSDMNRLFYFHRMWFGDDSVVYMIFKIWFLTILIINFTPVLQEILLSFQIKTGIPVGIEQ